MRVIRLVVCMLVLAVAATPLAFGLLLFASVLYGP